MPPIDRQTLPEPRWCAICKDRPTEPQAPHCSRERCVAVYVRLHAYKRATRCLGAFVLIIVGIVASFGYWLRGALS